MFELTESLYILIEALHQHYNRKVVVLIDINDRYLMSSMSEDNSLYLEAIFITRSLLSPIEQLHAELEFSVLAVVLNMFTSEILKKLEHFSKRSFIGLSF